MIFSKSNKNRQQINAMRALSIMAVLFIVGCSTGCSTTPPTADNTKLDSIPADTPLLSLGEPTPHPYYKGKRASVSREHKQLFSRARSEMAKKHWANAAQILASITDANPKLSGVWLNLGICYEQQEATEKAQAAFEKAIKANKNNIAAYNQLAVNYREQGKFNEALAIYQSAIDVWQFDVDTHKNIGILYDLYLGQWPQALQHYQIAQALLSEPDRTLKGWIIDLERRIAAQGAQ